MRAFTTLLHLGLLLLLTLAAVPPSGASAAPPSCSGVDDGGIVTCQIPCSDFRTDRIVHVAGAGYSDFPYYAEVGYSGCGLSETFDCYFSYAVDPGPGAATCDGFVPATTATGFLTCYADYFVGPFTCNAEASI